MKLTMSCALNTSLDSPEHARIAEFGRLDMVPGGEKWAAAYDDIPAETRHLELHEFAEGGATEIAYQPAGPDVPRELEAFAKAMQG